MLEDYSEWGTLSGSISARKEGFPINLGVTQGRKQEGLCFIPYSPFRKVGGKWEPNRPVVLGDLWLPFGSQLGCSTMVMDGKGRPVKTGFND